MRVIAGTYKGRRLKPPDWDGLRPTSDRLKETLFNILAPRVAGARVIEGYAGSGALGIEALSRGAGFVVFVDADPRAGHLIAENLAHCGIGDRCVIIRARLEGIAAPVPGLIQADLVLLDPPYDEEDSEQVLRRIAGWVTPTGMVVLEHARRRTAPATAGPLTRTRQVVSGDSALAFYRVDPAPETQER